MTATDIHHEANRRAAVADMATRLVAECGNRMPRFSYRSVVQAALDCALGLTEAQRTELGRRCGHYLETGSAPHSDTIGAVVAMLEAMIPGTGDPFEGLGATA